jgi:SAM-dependent methyltransferase
MLAPLQAVRSFLARARLVAPRRTHPSFAEAYWSHLLPEAVEQELGRPRPALPAYAALSRGWHGHAAPLVPRYGAYLAFLVEEGLVGRAAALDLACGTGVTAGAMSWLFGRVHALDLSPHMLEAARGQLRACRNVEFLEADFRAFSLPERVDVAVSSGDALNYVARPAELDQVLGCVRDALRPGGLFLFDLEAESSFLSDSHLLCRYRTAEVEWLQVHAYDPATRVDEARAVTSAGVESHRRVYLAPDDVWSAAGRAGFRPFARLDTPLLRWLGRGGGRDFYALRRA